MCTTTASLARNFCPGGPHRAAPMQALLQRLGSGAQVNPWAAYLPDGLRPMGVNPARPEANEQFSFPSVTVVLAKKDCVPEPVSEGVEFKGRVWELSQQKVGCRQVQHALHEAESDLQREALASELHGHVVEASKCPHDNHVLHRIMLSMPSPSVQFIVDELFRKGVVTQMAQHKFGCRILQGLLEFCPASQMKELVRKLLAELHALAAHAYGNFLTQALLKFGTDEDHDRILQKLTEIFRSLVSETHSCAVISAALSYGDASRRQKFARVLLDEPGLPCSWRAVPMGMSPCYGF